MEQNLVLIWLNSSKIGKKYLYYYSSAQKKKNDEKDEDKNEDKEDTGSIHDYVTPCEAFA